MDEYDCEDCGLTFPLSDLAYWDLEGFWCEVESKKDVEIHDCLCNSCMGKLI